MAKGGAKGAAAGEGGAAGADPAVFSKNYAVMCKVHGVKANEGVLEALGAAGEEGAAFDHVASDSELGPAGARALVDALLGTHEAVAAAGAYRLINTLRLWRAKLSDEGVRAVHDYLVQSARADPKGEGPALVYLQLLDCDVSVQGCQYLGQALRAGGNNRLLTLNLDHNASVRAQGLKALTEGLCTNSTLKRLSLAYCEIGPEGGRSVKNLLLGVGTQLEQLDLKGNRIGGQGVTAFAKALGKNKMLKSLDISNNDLGPNTEAMAAIAAAVKANTTLLELRMQENGIGAVGAQVLIDSGAFDKKEGNTTLKEFLVDIKLPLEAFELLLRAGAPAGKKGKGKKK